MVMLYLLYYDGVFAFDEYFVTECCFLDTVKPL